MRWRETSAKRAPSSPGCRRRNRTSPASSWSRGSSARRMDPGGCISERRCGLRWRRRPSRSRRRPRSPAGDLKGTEKGITAIAVLPFLSYGDTAGSMQAAAEMVTDNLTNTLSHAPGLRVISRQTMQSYRGQPIDIAAIGAELGVRYILEGSLRMHGDKLRVNVELVDPVTRLPVWSARIEKGRWRAGRRPGRDRRAPRPRGSILELPVIGRADDLGCPVLRRQFAPDARNRSPDGAAANLRVQASRLSCQRPRNPPVQYCRATHGRHVFADLRAHVCSPLIRSRRSMIASRISRPLHPEE